MPQYIVFVFVFVFGRLRLRWPFAIWFEKIPIKVLLKLTEITHGNLNASSQFWHQHACKFVSRSRKLSINIS